MTQADQYREMLQEGMRASYAKEVMEFASGRWKGDAYLPAPGERYDPDPFGVWRMSESEYLAFLQTQPALPEDEPNAAGRVPVGAGAATAGDRP